MVEEGEYNVFQESKVKTDTSALSFRALLTAAEVADSHDKTKGENIPVI